MVDARRLNSPWPLYHSATPLRPFAPATPPDLGVRQWAPLWRSGHYVAI